MQPLCSSRLRFYLILRFFELSAFGVCRMESAHVFVDVVLVAFSISLPACNISAMLLTFFGVIFQPPMKMKMMQLVVIMSFSLEYKRELPSSTQSSPLQPLRRKDETFTERQVQKEPISSKKRREAD